MLTSVSRFPRDQQRRISSSKQNSVVRCCRSISFTVLPFTQLDASRVSKERGFLRVAGTFVSSVMRNTHKGRVIRAHIHRARYIPQFPPIITRITNNNRSKGFVPLDKSTKFGSKIAIKNLTLAPVECASGTIALVCL